MNPIEANVTEKKKNRGEGGGDLVPTTVPSGLILLYVQSFLHALLDKTDPSTFRHAFQGTAIYNAQGRAHVG